MIFESNNLDDYLSEIPPYIRFDTPQVHKMIAEIKSKYVSSFEQAKAAFEIARDEIRHSFDTGETGVPISGEETLRSKNGICFAKAHLLACLLRGLGIPCGFCYQRVMRKGTPDSGYALHGLNAIYLEEVGWFRVDPRGNKPGVDSQFTTEKEQLAYPIRTELGEIDYPEVYVAPLPEVIEAMEQSKTSQELFYKRPERVLQ